MNKFWKRALGLAFSAALTLGVFTVSADAASSVQVRVDDQAVTFTDAQPIIQNDRTYVPFRAIFEQMGATVSWDNPTRTVIAQRGDRTVRLTIGDAAVTITENGDTRTLQTDAPAFIQNERTLVPVRFAAQALGACVDWENSTKTVLIVDVDKLMDDYAKTYTTMDSYLDFAAPAGVQSLLGTFALDLTYHTAQGDVPVGMDGSIAGTENADAMQLSGKMTTDVAALQAAVEKNEGKALIDPELTALLEKLSGQQYDMIVSRVDSALYLKTALLDELGVPVNGWVSLPLDSLAGGAMSDALTAIANRSFADYVAAQAQSTSLKEAPTTTVATMRAVLAGYAQTYGDDKFQKNGNAVQLTQTDANGTTSLTLRYSVQGVVLSAELSSTSSADGAVSTIKAVQEDGAYRMTATLTGGKTLDLKMVLDLTSAAGETAPAVRPSGEVVNVSLR